MNRKAMPIHHTDTSDAPWDAAKMLKRLGDSPTTAQLKAMHAWMSPEGDPTAKSSYKLPHHEVSEDGQVGAANMKACSSAMGALNGARGGVDIPEEDRQAVHDHLAAHMKDGDMEPPEMRRQQRSFPVQEFRFLESEEGYQFHGEAIIFDTLSEDLGGWYEEIAPEAVDRALAEGQDVRLCINHEDLPLARTVSGTMTLTKDLVRNALRVEASLDPSDLDVQRLVPKMRRGDVSQMSFSFRPKARVRADRDGKMIWRVTDMDLYDVSVVGIPAYTETKAVLRSLAKAQSAVQAITVLSQEGSYEWIRDRLQSALPHNPGCEYWIEQTFPEFCVVTEWRPGVTEYWLVPYVIEDGVVTFGEWLPAQKKLTFEPRKRPWLEDFVARSQTSGGRLDISEAPEAQGSDGDPGEVAQGRLRLLRMKADLAALE